MTNMSDAGGLGLKTGHPFGKRHSAAAGHYP